MTRARCTGCGTELMGTTALYCVHCYRLRCRRCPQCTLPGGKLHPTYRRHVWEKDGPCPRCQRPHPDPVTRVQLRCEMCGNERWVLQTPEPAPASP
jgi:hypothetical protein